ncbi:hypothetical protein EXIGLDRAFT_844636 [Exidia glandulosa HHB12029]|uniref:F-box domain-containing protein n=1 Tax=Exidia glandulosa HHB12029 TaxID=1314781 RepID=A0A165BWU5_EXIGL|nr:hypothetical protein EXIGLDRAFT_844636 [Exidia glandulosa HHB12029]
MVDTVRYHARPGPIEPAALIQRVPVELLLHIVDYLPARHLLLVSGVSKLFRSVVARHARFYIPLHIGITLITVTNVSCDEQLTRVRHVLQYAVPQRLPVGIKVKCEYLGPSPQHFLAFATQSVFPVIEAALPILARLVVTIPDVYNQALHDTLRHPAPALRELKLSRSKSRVQEGESGHVVPHDIFQGRAPLLARISLQNVYLPERPIPALCAATHVSLTYGYYSPKVHVSRFFPHVADLRLRARSAKCRDLRCLSQMRGFGRQQLSGSRSRSRPRSHLCFVDDDGCGLLQSLLESCDIAGIPTITYPGVCARVDDYRTLASQMRGPLSLRITSQGFKYQVSLRTQAQPGLHRVFHVDDRYVDYDQGPFSYISIVCPRLVDLQLDGGSLFDILEFSCPFPELRTLRLDLGDDAGFAQSIWFPCAPDEDGGERATERLFDCPQLQSIVLVARAPSITVCPRQVAFIGCAFGQMRRPIDERARLEMIGATFQVDTSARVDHPDLDVAFPN